MLKIKVALCSYGMSGSIFHAPFIHLHEGFSFTGALERSKKNINQHYNYVKSYDNFNDLINDEIDVVVVNTPPNTHYEYAKQALLSDKHVIVEKPFTTTSKEGEALQYLAKQQDKQIFVYHNRRWDSDFKTVFNVVKSNLLGDILQAEFRFERYKQDFSAKLFKENGDAGSGLLYDLGPHLIDQALCLFGMPNKLFATLKTQRKDSKVDDYFNIILWYNNNLQVTLIANLMAKIPQPAFVIHGQQGSFVKPRGDTQEQLLLNKKKPNVSGWAVEHKDNYGQLSYLKNGTTIHQKIKSEYGNYYDFYDDVYNTLSQHKTSFVTIQDGINSIKIIETALKSHLTNTVIHL